MVLESAARTDGVRLVREEGRTGALDLSVGRIPGLEGAFRGGMLLAARWSNFPGDVTTGSVLTLSALVVSFKSTTHVTRSTHCLPETCWKALA